MVKFSVYLNRHVFVMASLTVQNVPRQDFDQKAQADMNFAGADLFEGTFSDIAAQNWFPFHRFSINELTAGADEAVPSTLGIVEEEAPKWSDRHFDDTDFKSKNKIRPSGRWWDMGMIGTPEKDVTFEYGSKLNFFFFFFFFQQMTN